MDILPPKQCRCKPRPDLSFIESTPPYLHDLPFGLLAYRVTSDLSVPYFCPHIATMSHHSRSPSSHASRALSSHGSRSPYSQALKPLSYYGSTSSPYQDCSNHPVQQVQIPITTLAPCPRSQDLFDSSVDPRGYPHKTSYPLLDSDLKDVTNHTSKLRRPIGDRSTSHASAYARLQTFNERRLNKSRINAQKTFMVLTVLDKEGQWWADFVPIVGIHQYSNFQVESANEYSS